MKTSSTTSSGRYSRLLHIISLLLIAALLSSMITVPTFAASSSRSSISEGTYAIKLHDDTSRVINVLFASKAEDRAEIGVDPYNSENNEKFIIRHRGNNYYSIHPVHAENLCLNALLGNRTPGDKVTLHRYENGDNCSLWSFHKNSDGSYTIKNKYTGLVLDITNGDYTTGNRVINWTSNDYLRAQAFYLTNVSGSASSQTSIAAQIASQGRASVSEGTYAIKLHDDTSRGINVIYASTTEDKAEVGVDPYNSENNERFIIRHRGNNYYSIHPVHASWLCLNALLGNKTPGDKLTLHTYESGDNCSLWSFHKNLDGSYTIKNKHTGLVLDVTNGNYTTGNRIISWTSNNYMRAQAFYLTKVSSSTSVSSKPAASTSSKLLYPLKGSLKRTSVSAKTNGIYCDFVTGGNLNLYAPTSGTVTYYQTVWNNTLVSYGNWIEFTSSDGVYKIKMAHLNSFNGVSLQVPSSRTARLSASQVSGEKTISRGTRKVSQKEILGVTGVTGNSSGHHLHMEVYKNGKAVDPASVFTTWN